MTVESLVAWLATTVVLGNSLMDYVLFLGTFVGFILIFQLLQMYVIRKLELLASKTRTDIDNVIIRVIKTIKPPFYLFLAFYWALRLITVDPLVNRVVQVILICWVAIQVVMALQVALDSIFLRRLQHEKDQGHHSILEVLRSVVRFVLWVVGILFVLSNVGVNINSLIAGLGIGGIAVALASQNILSDLFNSLVIYFDQPFQPGDFIVIGNDRGTVQKIGVKTTRLRSLSGEEIIIPNRDVAAARVKNFKRLMERRVEFEVVVAEDVLGPQLEQVPHMLQEIVGAVPHVRFGRAHLHTVHDGRRVFEVIYYVIERDYTAYMEAQANITLGIINRFSQERIALTAVNVVE